MNGSDAERALRNLINDIRAANGYPRIPIEAPTHFDGMYPYGAVTVKTLTDDGERVTVITDCGERITCRSVEGAVEYRVYRGFADGTTASRIDVTMPKAMESAAWRRLRGVMGTDADKDEDKFLAGLAGIILLIILLATLGAP